MTWHALFWQWLAHTALATLVLLTLGCLAVRLCRQPARKALLIERVLLACLLAPWLGLLPVIPRVSLGWLDTGPAPTTRKTDAEPAGAGSSEEDRALVTVSRQASGPGASPAARAVAQRPTNPDQPARPGTASSPQSGRVTTFEDGSAPAPGDGTPGVPPFTLLVTLAYLAGVAFLLLRWLAGVIQLMRLHRGAIPVPDAVARVFHEMAGPEGAGVCLLSSDRAALPLMFCWWRPIVVLPSRLCQEGDTPALRYCLAHEWSHVERRDTRTWHLATLAGLFLFYQPLFWWLRRTLRLCQDYLADARAAEQADTAEDYAEYLVTVARLWAVAPEPVPAALGIGDRRSNLYRRILMLIETDRPLERRCRPTWSIGTSLAALLLLSAVSAVRLDAGPRPAPETTRNEEEKSNKPAAPVKGERLKYTGQVKDKDTGKPIPGATVTVRRARLGDPRDGGEFMTLQETRHTTDAAGKYSFVIPPEQSAERYLYIELDVEHPDYAPRAGFGYALGMIRKNEKLGGRPFFENVELRPGKPISGTLETPAGKPAAGVRILAYSRTTRKTEDFEYGSFASTRTDAKGQFRLALTTPGEAIFWILPKDYAPSTHKLVDNKRGALGTFVLQKGIRVQGKVFDARGKPMAGIYVNARRENIPENERVDFVADAIGRSARTNDRGEFEMGPLAPGSYRIQPDEHGHEPSEDRRQRFFAPFEAVFIAQNLTLKENEQPPPLEVRAVPHVVIEAQHFDSKGKKIRGHEFHVFGRIDNSGWFTRSKQDANGKVTVLVPHGLERVQLNLMTNEHGVLRWRKSKNDRLSSKRRVDLGTVNADVTGIEIIRYTAPILVVKVTAKDGGKLEKVGVTADYAGDAAPRSGKFVVANGRNSDVSFERQEDGRFRSSQLLPDEEVTVTGHADGYEPQSEKVTLAEGKQKEIVIVLEKKN
jgi:protocatechuate 3,4-dioxygenase beta subunit